MQSRLWHSTCKPDEPAIESRIHCDPTNGRQNSNHIKKPAWHVNGKIQEHLLVVDEPPHCALSKETGMTDRKPNGKQTKLAFLPSIDCSNLFKMITEFLGHIWKQHSIVKEDMILLQLFYEHGTSMEPAVCMWTWRRVVERKNANFHNILIMHNAINVNDVM